MLDLQKINEIINQLEILKYEITELQEQIENQEYVKLKQFLFEKLAEIVNDKYIGSVIFIDNNDVKYIAQNDFDSGDSNYIVYNDNAYYWYKHLFYDSHLSIYYTVKYNIPVNIVMILKTIPESIISNANYSYFKLYYLLKKNYKFEFVKT
jgi:hypothetical protein